MRKETCGTVLLWLLPLLGLLLCTLWTGSAAALAGLAALLLLLLTSEALAFVQARRLSVRLTLPPSAAKNAEINGTLTLAADTRLPIGRVCCTLELKNELTGERDELFLRAAPGQNAFSFRAVHCGQIRVSVRRAVLTGLSGLCIKHIKTDAAAQLTVLPDTFVTDLFLHIDPAQSDDSDDAPDRPGSDLTEPYSLREYRPGDSLKQLHWKLSEKLDRLIVREGSAPVSRSLLFLWDRGGSPDALDAQAEVLFSVGQALGQAGLPFTLGWTSPEGLRLAEAATESEALFETLALTLRDGVPQEKNEMLDGAMHFGKTLRLCASLSTVPSEANVADTTVLLCGTEAADTSLPVIRFTPTDYKTALRHLEL